MVITLLKLFHTGLPTLTSTPLPIPLGMHLTKSTPPLVEPLDLTDHGTVIPLMSLTALLNLFHVEDINLSQLTHTQTTLDSPLKAKVSTLAHQFTTFIPTSPQEAQE